MEVIKHSINQDVLGDVHFAKVNFKRANIAQALVDYTAAVVGNVLNRNPSLTHYRHKVTSVFTYLTSSFEISRKENRFILGG